MRRFRLWLAALIAPEDACFAKAYEAKLTGAYGLSTATSAVTQLRGFPPAGAAGVPVPLNPLPHTPTMWVLAKPEGVFDFHEPVGSYWVVRDSD